MHDPTECVYAEGFTFWQKLYAQISFNVMAIVGIIGVALVSPWWMIPYAFVYLYGVPFIIMRHLSCPRCPHLNAYGDCLQFPPSVTKRLIKKQKITPFNVTEKILFYGIFILLPVYPLYWLVKTPVLLVVFLVSAIVWYGGQFVYYCKHCRVGACPFNRSPLRHNNQDA